MVGDIFPRESFTIISPPLSAKSQPVTASELGELPEESDEARACDRVGAGARPQVSWCRSAHAAGYQMHVSNARLGNLTLTSSPPTMAWDFQVWP